MMVYVTVLAVAGASCTSTQSSAWPKSGFKVQWRTTPPSVMKRIAHRCVGRTSVQIKFWFWHWVCKYECCEKIMMMKYLLTYHYWYICIFFVFLSFQEPVSAPVEKFYFLNVNRVEYTRETLTPTPADSTPDPNLRDKPNHRLVVHGLKVGVSFTVFLPFCITLLLA